MTPTVLRSRHAALVALAVAVLVVAALVAYRRTAAGSDDQCAKPVAERTGGWFCYQPTER